MRLEFDNFIGQLRDILLEAIRVVLNLIFFGPVKGVPSLIKSSQGTINRFAITITLTMTA